MVQLAESGSAGSFPHLEWPVWYHLNDKGSRKASESAFWGSWPSPSDIHRFFAYKSTPEANFLWFFYPILFCIPTAIAMVQNFRFASDTNPDAATMDRLDREEQKQQAAALAFERKTM